MHEGSVPFPHFCPRFYKNNGVLPVRWYLIRGAVSVSEIQYQKMHIRKNLLNEQFSFQLRFVFVNP
jgi:hypothetical protein